MSVIFAAMLNVFVPSLNTQHITKLSQRHQQIKDFIALEYCKNHANTYILIVFPMANKENDHMIRSIANDFGKIIHSKKFYLSENEALNFLKLVYKGHGRHSGHWLGSPENNFKGARQAVKERFSNPKIPLRIYLYETKNLSVVQKCKLMLRKYIGMSREPVHANDTHEETIKIAKVMFDKNASELLEH